MQLSRRIAGCLPCLFILLSCSGCGDDRPPTYDIPGKLVYEDGTPVANASVVLQTAVGAENYAARGMVGADGAFRLSTFEEGDGVVEGEHTVSISSMPLPDGEKRVQPPVPQGYWDFNTSGLTTAVTPDMPEIVITINRAGPKK